MRASRQQGMAFLPSESAIQVGGERKSHRTWTLLMSCDLDGTLFMSYERLLFMPSYLSWGNFWTLLHRGHPCRPLLPKSCHINPVQRHLWPVGMVQRDSSGTRISSDHKGLWPIVEALKSLSKVFFGVDRFWWQREGEWFVFTAIFFKAEQE